MYPAVFQPHDASVRLSYTPTREVTPPINSECIERYLHIARKHINDWVDVLRHVEWMLKNHPSITPIQRAGLFQTTNLPQLGHSISPNIECSHPAIPEQGVPWQPGPPHSS